MVDLALNDLPAAVMDAGDEECTKTVTLDDKKKQKGGKQSNNKKVSPFAKFFKCFGSV